MRMQAEGKSWQGIKPIFFEARGKEKKRSTRAVRNKRDDEPTSTHIWHNHTAPGHFMCERKPDGRKKGGKIRRDSLPIIGSWSEQKIEPVVLDSR